MVSGTTPGDGGVADGSLDAATDAAPDDGAVDGGVDGSLACTTVCDCEQGQVCQTGSCFDTGVVLVYCCEKPGCLLGAVCQNSDGNFSYCPKDDLG